MKIRAETPEDHDAIAKVIAAAFETEDEVRLVEAIRTSDNFVRELALVAEQDSTIVGRILQWSRSTGRMRCAYLHSHRWR
jgi:putative acetyltransferase